MRSARLLAASLIICAAAGARAETIGNGSLVTEVQGLPVDDATTAVALQFVAEQSGPANLASLWVTAVSSGTGSNRTYKLGLRERDPSTGAPKSTWLSGPSTISFGTFTAPGWSENPVNGSLVAGSTYFLVLEKAGTATNRTATLGVSAPETDLIPLTGAATTRGVWSASGAAAWQQRSGLEPIFLLGQSLPDPICGSSYQLVTGNPYSSSGSVTASIYPVLQTFEVTANYEISTIELALADVQSSSVRAAILDKDGTQIFRDYLSAGEAPWYVVDTTGLLLGPGGSPYTMQLSLVSGTVAWLTSKVARIDTSNSSGSCDRPVRASFGAKGHLVIDSGIDSHRYDEDGLFRLTGCLAINTYYRDFDGDGFGTPALARTTCTAPSGYVENSLDCDDRNRDVRPGATEVCDGADNDCDGTQDDVVPADAALCIEQRGVCAGATKRCGGASGWIDCVLADYGASFEEFERTCDGLDNNCDGETDNVEEADRPACEKNQGVCAGSTAVCAGAAGWAACDAGRYGPHYQEVEERCDGRDNDCDGVTDEAFAPEPCTRQSGVCLGATKRCVGGALWDCTEQDYAAHSPDFEAGLESRCDGLDNDCNGRIDDYTPTAEELCPNQLGVCAGSPRPCGAQGMSECAEATYASHSGAWQAEETTCDGLDNDCDGETDEMPAESMPACLEQRGLCAGTRQVCSGGTLAGCDELWLSRNVNGFESRERSCDGADNDCDGVVDPPELCSSQQPDAGHGSAAPGAASGCGCGPGGAPPFLLLALLPFGLLRRRG